MSSTHQYIQSLPSLDLATLGLSEDHIREDLRDKFTRRQLPWLPLAAIRDIYRVEKSGLEGYYFGTCRAEDLSELGRTLIRRHPVLSYAQRKRAEVEQLHEAVTASNFNLVGRTILKGRNLVNSHEFESDWNKFDLTLSTSPLRFFGAGLAWLASAGGFALATIGVGLSVYEAGFISSDALVPSLAFIIAPFSGEMLRRSVVKFWRGSMALLNQGLVRHLLKRPLRHIQRDVLHFMEEKNNDT